MTNIYIHELKSVCLLLEFLADIGNQLSTEEMDEARHKLEINSKMKAMIREVCYYLGFLLLLILVINTNQDANTFYQNVDLVNTYASSMDEVSY